MSGFNPDLGSPDAPRTQPHVEALARGITQPEEVVFLPQKKAYLCSVMNASMHHTDGTRIGFVNGYIETDIKHICEYLDKEIERGNSYLKKASEDEVQTARMRINPRETIREQVKKELEPVLRKSIEAQIRAEMGLPAVSEVEVTDADKLKQSDLSAKLASIGVIRTPNANIVMGAGAAPLQGIVSTANLGGAQAGSASSGPGMGTE